MRVTLNLPPDVVQLMRTTSARTGLTEAAVIALLFHAIDEGRLRICQPQVQEENG